MNDGRSRGNTKAQRLAAQCLIRDSEIGCMSNVHGEGLSIQLCRNDVVQQHCTDDLLKDPLATFFIFVIITIENAVPF